MSIVLNRRTPIRDVPPIRDGSMPIDSGHLVLLPGGADAVQNSIPWAVPFIRPFVGGDEFLNGVERFCLWLDGAPPAIVRDVEPIRERVASTVPTG